MTSDVQICNIALGRVGCQQFINSLDDPTTEAAICKKIYGFTLERVLQDFPWQFATRYVDLQDVGSPVSPWGYRYRYPNDCLQARRIVPPGCGYTQVPFCVIADSESNGKAILCDQEAAVLEYTAHITLTGLFSPAFSNALAWAIAAEIATPLSADPKYAQVANQTYVHTLAEAGALSFGESQQAPLPDGELIAARNA
jgi:hypothetical protein